MEEQMDRIISEREVAKLIGVSTMTLDRWAQRGLGPDRIKLSERKIGYRQSDVKAWMENLPSVTVRPKPAQDRQLQAA